MRKQNKALLVLSILSGMVVYPALASTGPAELRGENGSTFTMTVSRESANVLMVQGDRITALTSKASDVPDPEKTGNGAVMFSVATEKPFTFVIETESGQVFSVRATPVKGQGRVYRIAPLSPVSHPATKVWEKGNPYESLLLALSKGVLTGNIPDGYSLVDDKERDASFTGPVRAKRLQVWDGGNLRVEKYRLTNPNSWGLSLNERDYASRGVRSVMFWPRSSVLPGGATVSLYLIRDLEVNP